MREEVIMVENNEDSIFKENMYEFVSADKHKLNTDYTTVTPLVYSQNKKMDLRRDNADGSIMLNSYIDKIVELFTTKPDLTDDEVKAAMLEYQFSMLTVNQSSNVVKYEFTSELVPDGVKVDRHKMYFNKNNIGALRHASERLIIDYKFFTKKRLSF